jgi:hypothetical protein
MARIRSIKPSLWSDQRVAQLSRDARLLFLGLISSADDSGRFLASPQVILGYVYPHDRIPPAKIQKWLDEIASVGLIVLYQPNGLQYGAFRSGARHQRISHPQPSTIPAPPAIEGELW